MRAQRLARVLRKDGYNKQELTTMQTILDGALKILGNGKKWVQGSMKEKDTFCALGAIEHFPSNVPYTVKRDVKQVLALALPGMDEESLFDVDYMEVADFNDKADREFGSIQRLFRRARKAVVLAKSKEKR